MTIRSIGVTMARFQTAESSHFWLSRGPNSNAREQSTTVVVEANQILGGRPDRVNSVESEVSTNVEAVSNKHSCAEAGKTRNSKF